MWSDTIFTVGQPDKAKINFCARMASAAYQNGIPPIGNFDNYRAIQTGAQYGPVYACEIDGETIVAIAGTRGFLQLADQLLSTFGDVVYEGVNVNPVHRACVTALRPVIDQLPDPLLLVGHSLGGSAAWLLSRYYKLLGRPIEGVVTFGSPKVYSQISGPANDGHWGPGVNVWNQFDPVTMIPTDFFPLLIPWTIPGINYEVTADHQLILSSPRSASKPLLLATLAAVGTDWHSSLQYVTLTNEQAYVVPVPYPLPGPAPTIPGPIPGGSTVYHCKITVNAVQSSQRIQNVFWYLVPDTVTTDDMLTLFSYIWESNFIPLMANTYSVLLYEAAKLDSIVRINADPDPIIGGVRWGARSSQSASAVAVGALSSPAETFVAIGARKSCEPYLNADGTALTVARKSPRGSVRFAGVPEAATTENALTTAAKNQWQPACNKLRNLGGSTIVMEVLTLLAEGGDQIVSGGGSLSYNYATVNALVLNPYASSQVTRKQSINRLG